MMERGKQVGFAFEVLHNGLTHQRIWCTVDHLFDRNQFGHVGEVHVTGAVNRAHSTKPYNFLDQIPLAKCNACLKLALGNGILFTLVVI